MATNNVKIAAFLLLFLMEACGGGGTAAPLSLTLRQVASNLAFPVFLSAPGGDPRLFIVERAGRIRIVENGSLLATPFLDIASRTSSDGERGLLSLAFHPRYADNGVFFIFYTDLAGDIVIERMRVAAGNRNAADPASGTIMLTIAHRVFNNHNGGLLSFGPDGLLYAGTGDGGGAGDPSGNGQDTNSLLGKLLRLDVDSAAPAYAIPPDNPFAGQAGRRGEIWAYGLRNPWRYAFDAPASLLYIADVGQAEIEEVDIAPASQGGNNYGWNIMEGTQCFNSASCSQAGLTLPALEYTHGAGNANGCSITGGYVYRGSAIPALVGHYLYSDYCGGWLKSVRRSNGNLSAPVDWRIPHVGNIVSFGQDGHNELYMLSQAGGIYRIVAK